MSFLRYTRINSTLPVQFKRTSVKFNDPDILNYPMVYMTGHTTFKLSDTEIAGLRNYMRNGGMIFASACCGSEVFDAAFRALMARALPDDVKLANLPLDHPV